MKITYTDDSVQWVDTGSDWKWSPGPYTATDNQLGETYDARNEQPGWDRSGFNAADWIGRAYVDQKTAQARRKKK